MAAEMRAAAWGAEGEGEAAAWTMDLILARLERDLLQRTRRAWQGQETRQFTIIVHLFHTAELSKVCQPGKRWGKQEPSGLRHGAFQIQRYGSRNLWTTSAKEDYLTSISPS